MKLNILFFILLHGVISSCTSQTILWSEYSFKGDFHAIVPLYDSTFVLVGGGDDWLLVGVDKTGAILWQKSMGTKGRDYALDIIADKDGGFLVLGSWEHNFDPPYRASKSRLAKFDKNGELIWEQIYTKGIYCSLSKIFELKEKGYILAGLFNSGKDNSESNRNYDAWIVRIDEYGKILWEKTIGGSGTDNITDVVQLADEQLLLSGYSFVYDKEAEDEENGQVILAQLTLDGTLIGSKEIGGIGYEGAEKIVPSPDGGFLLFGTTDSPDFGKPKSRYDKEEEEDEDEWDEDLFVCKINKQLKIEWIKRYGGTNTDSFWDCVATKRGVVMLGYSTSRGGDFAKSAFNEYSVVFEINWNGKTKWVNTFDRATISGVYSIGKINEEDFILTGKNEKAAGVLVFRKKGKNRD